MVNCCVYGCSNRTDRGKKKDGVGFHIFPKDEALRKLWIRAVRRLHWSPEESTKVCTEHFAESAINRTYASGPRLRENAVPTIFPSYPKHLQEALKNPKLPHPRVSNVLIELPTNQPEQRDSAGSQPEQEPANVASTSDLQVQNPILPLVPHVLIALPENMTVGTGTSQDDSSSMPRTRDFSVQVDDCSAKRKIEELLTQNKHLTWKLDQLTQKTAEKSRTIKQLRRVNLRLMRKEAALGTEVESFLD